MEVKVRRVKETDIPSIREILVGCGNFRKCEIDVALSLANLSLCDSGDYLVEVAVDDRDEVLGLICYGFDSLTDGTYVLYWIAVRRDLQGCGIGRFLMEHFEKWVRNSGGRMIVLETSSTDKYLKTREFYRRLGYQEEGVIKDYYLVGDDKIIFVKRLT